MKKVVDFDLEKAKSGAYEIVTRNGHSVRVLCWDKKGEKGEMDEFPIVTLVKKEGGNEIFVAYDKRGRAMSMKSDLNLVLQVDVELLELLTDFEYNVGDLMYGGYIDEINEEGLACVKAKARELLDLAKMELFNEAWFDSHNAKEIDILKSNVSECRISDNLKMVLLERGWDIIDAKNHLATLKDLLMVCTKGKWLDSEKSGVSNVRYSEQMGVIYDCVSGEEISERDVMGLVLRALNYQESEDEDVLKRKREKVERDGRMRKSLTTSKLEGRTSNDVGL